MKIYKKFPIIVYILADLWHLFECLRTQNKNVYNVGLQQKQINIHVYFKREILFLVYY